MAESTQVLRALKKAANYSKLALHKDGPKSFVKGQGAMAKVLVKLGEDGRMNLKGLGETLNWPVEEVVAVAEKSQQNGYVTIQAPLSDSFRLEGAQDDSAAEQTFVAITDKGREVMEKRFVAEDRAADEILSRLSDEERQQLADLCAKISEQCQSMGVDYSLIKKRRGKRCECKKDKKAKKAKKAEKKCSKKADKKGKKDKKHRHAHG